MTSIKGTTASTAAYTASLNSNFTGLKNVSAGITQYNILASKGATEQQAFSNAVTATNTSLGKYLTGLNGGKASLAGYGASLVVATVKTIGLTAASIALNAAVSMGMSVIITGLISAFTAWTNKSEEITQKAQEAADKIKSINDSLKTNTETVENAKRRYSELAQEVENLGKINQSRGSLNNEEYKEFLDLSNQLAGIFPTLTRGYDENGNAILDLSGDVNTVVGSLDNLIKKEQELANQKIIKEFPNVFSGFAQDLQNAKRKLKTAQSEFDKINNAYQALANGGVAGQAFDLQGNGWFTNDNGDRVNVRLSEYISNLEALGVAYKKTNITVKNQFGGDQLSGYLVTVTGDINTAFTSKLETTRNNLEYAKQQLEGEASSINQYLNTWLQTEFSYNQIEDSGLREAIQQTLFNFNWDSLPDNINKNDWAAVSEYLRKNVLFAINNVQDNPEISKALSDLFTNQELSPEQKNNLIKQIQDYFGKDNPISIFLQPQFEENETTQKNIDSAISKFGKDKESVLKEFFDKNSINTQEEVDKWNEVTNGINNAEDAMNAYTEAGKNVSKMTVSLSELEKVSDNISKLSSAFKELSDDGYITTKTLSEIKTATGLAEDEWTQYESKLLTAKKGSAEFNKVLSELTYKILENEFAIINLYNATEEEVLAIEQKIAATLRENGVVNADTIAHQYLAIKKEKARLETEGLTFATTDEAVALLNEAGASKTTQQALAQLALEKMAVNQAQINTSADIDNVIALANAAGASASALSRLRAAKEDLAFIEGTTGIGKLFNPDYYKKLISTSLTTKALENGTFDFEYKELDPNAFKVDYSGAGGKSKSGGDKGGSDKNEALENYLDNAERRYKIHQDETKYIQDLQYAYDKLAKTDKERLDIADKIDEAYRNFADNRIKDIEHQIDLVKELHGEDADVAGYYDQIQKIASEEANRLRSKGYDDNSNEIQSLQKTWWDAQNSKLDFYNKQHENIIRDIEHARDMALEQNPYADTTSYYKQMQDEYHKEAERLRALDPEKYKEDIQQLQLAWWEAHNAILDWRWENSNNWISDRNAYNDWALFDDSEVDAWERVIKWLHEEYPNDLDRIKEAEQNLFDARKEEFNKATDFGNTYLESQKTLLQSHYDVTNAIAEAQHELNKELKASKSMYEYLDEETRELLFNQEDYNKLSKELNIIEKNALRLQSEYEDKLKHSTLETVESITAEYEMQYETLMKSYEIAKADLEIAKKKQQLNNVLNERNVRMFINGQWQWVANTEDVINAKSELADAEYAKQVEEAGLTQQESINNLTRQQDELGIVVKKFENGVISLNQAVIDAGDAIAYIPQVMQAMLKKAKVDTKAYSTGSSSRSYKGVWYDSNTDYMANILNASSEAEVLENNSLRNAKIFGDNRSESTMSNDKAIELWKKAKGHASGIRYTPGGLTKMGENGEEFYITSIGRLIPITQPTIGNIPSGGVVFNREQLKNLRTMWDMSNLNFSSSAFIGNAQPQQIDQSQDNRIIINGMTVDSGSSDGQALISALRRYVGNH